MEQQETGAVRPEQETDAAQQPTAEGGAQKKQQPKGYEAYLTLYDLVRLLAVITIIFVFFFRLVGVDGSSMYPTLVDHDSLVLESNFLYRTAKPGDIVVLNTPPFSQQGKLIVKRVIATAGQEVDIRFDTGEVYVDGQLLDEPYISEPTQVGSGWQEYPLTVPEGCVFIMGDNRNHSSDSRLTDVGCVRCDSILGRALICIVPGHETDIDGNVTGPRDLRRIGTVS